MEQKNLDTLFSPRSIAVVGASTEPGSVGNDVAKNLIGSAYDGEVFLVNPKTNTLFDRKCHAKISDLPETPDLAIIIVPAGIVPGVLRETAEKGTGAAIVISAGFKESGEDGLSLENELVAIAKEYGVALLGPNCLGFLHPNIGLNASFAPTLPDGGGNAFFSQSGALCTAILDLSRGKIGFSKFVSTGNKASIDERDLLAYFAADEATKTISFYSENLSDAPGIVSLGRGILSRAEPKPVIALKSGRTDSGMKASSSHTGALAGSDAAYDALFRQARMLRAGSLRELLDSVALFSQNRIPDGHRVAIITNAGGPGVLAADAAVKAGLSMAKLSPETKAALRESLPKAASVENPIDVLGDAKADRYRSTLERITKEEGVDSMLVILTPQSMTEAGETARAIVDAKRASGKPVVAVFAGASLLREGADILREAGVSVFSYPEEAAQALGSLSQVAKWQTSSFSPKSVFDDIDTGKAKEVITRAYAEERTMLYEREAYEVLAAYGFPLLKSRYVRNAEEAARAAGEIGARVAIKIVSPDIVHKTESDGVMLDVKPEEAGKGYEELLHRVRMKAPEATLEGAMVIEMARSGGKELILGLKKEPGLGTVIVVGLGGIYTEMFKDASFRFVPIVREDAEEMLDELRSRDLLKGVRGETGIDTDHLISLLERLSRLAEDFPEIKELDINPLMVFPDKENFRIIDARIAIEN
jgi:acetyl coenzyme A synthetase (ADP forming)-like protein